MIRDWLFFPCSPLVWLLMIGICYVIYLEVKTWDWPRGLWEKLKQGRRKTLDFYAHGLTYDEVGIRVHLHCVYRSWVWDSSEKIDVITYSFPFIREIVSKLHIDEVESRGLLDGNISISLWKYSQALSNKGITLIDLKVTGAERIDDVKK